jgi:hypothetical protein
MWQEPTSRRQATCPAAPSATIRLFRQLGGHMHLVTGIRFGNVVRLALVFSNGGDFGFGVVQRISGYANRLSEASERDQSIPAAASNFTFFMVFILLTFMVESVLLSMDL